MQSPQGSLAGPRGAQGPTGSFFGHTFCLTGTSDEDEFFAPGAAAFSAAHAGTPPGSSAAFGVCPEPPIFPAGHEHAAQNLR